MDISTAINSDSTVRTMKIRRNSILLKNVSTDLTQNKSEDLSEAISKLNGLDNLNDDVNNNYVNIDNGDVKQSDGKAKTVFSNINELSDSYKPILIKNATLPLKVAARRKSSYDMSSIVVESSLNTNSSDSFIQSAPATSKVRRSSLLLAGIGRDREPVELPILNSGLRSSSTTSSSKDSFSDNSGST